MGKNVYSSAEMEALGAVCDTFLPSIDVNQEDQKLNYDQSVIEFFQTSASMAGTPQRLVVMLEEKVKHPKIYLIRYFVIWMLSTRIGTFVLCGRKSLSADFPYFQRFSKVSSQKREEILHSWSTSFFFHLRLLYTSLRIFALLAYFTQVNEKNENPSWKAIGYCGPDPARKTRKPQCQDQHEEDCPSNEEIHGPLYKGIINLNQQNTTALQRLQTLGFGISTPQSRSPKYDSLKPSFIIQCDAVVVGSGSGGGVVAGVLAKAGHKVLVLEKGSYMARSNLSLLEGEALDQMYLGNGLMGSDKMDIIMLAGSTVGGGSTVNWSASLRTPQHVTKEWSEKYKLELFGSKAYEDALDVVCQRMGVQSEIDDEGFNNMILRKGCENLGYPVENIPRNASSDHYCGWCCLGCSDGKKKGTAEAWLVDLVESGNGAILPECEALKVLTDRRNGQKRATGVAFQFQSTEGVKRVAIVESRVTIVACGAICTPPLLKRSGVTKNVGKNLRVHPVAMAWGYFPNQWPEAEKTSYEGGIMTAMSTKLVPPSGYGAILQTPSLHPGLFSALMPWISGRDFKNRMLKFSRTAHVIVLARDKGSGAIASESNISYSLEDSDRENINKGIEIGLRIMASAGAEEIGTHYRDGRVLKVKEAGEKEFERFVKEESTRPLRDLSTPICSAHQMGSCRMGVDPRGSVVNPKGESWEVEGMFLADTSVFPTALGVNPMVTVQAIAYCTAQSVLEVLGKKKTV